MNSSDVSQYGFVSWNAFTLSNEKSLLNVLAKKPGTYVIRRKEPISRFVGNSDIAYVGSATNAGGLRQRVYQYFHPGPTQDTNRRIRALIANNDNFEISVVERSSSQDAQVLEKRILADYDNEHFELPPLNRKG